MKYHNPSKTYICDICGKAETTITTLRKHKENVHEPKVPEQCRYCGQWYSSRRTALRHIRNMHLHANEEHRCEICGFVSSSKPAKKRHIEFKHNPEKKHKCTMCEKAFKTPTLLKVGRKMFSDWKAFHLYAKFKFFYRNMWPPIRV